MVLLVEWSGMEFSMDGLVGEIRWMFGWLDLGCTSLSKVRSISDMWTWSSWYVLVELSIVDGK